MMQTLIHNIVLPREIDPKDSQRIQTHLKSAHPPALFHKQLHGTKIYVVKEIPGTQNTHEIEGDILLTHLPQVPLVIRIADCASVMMYDPEQQAIANVHAGWRGISQRILREAVLAMKKEFRTDPKNIIANVSPMIGPCCCIFTEPEKELPKFMQKFVNEENHVDLWAAVEAQLAECGLQKNNISNPRICTFCNPEKYPSRRRQSLEGVRDGDSSERFGTAVMLK